MYLDEPKKWSFWKYDEYYWDRKQMGKLLCLPFRLINHAIRMRMSIAKPGPGTFNWKGKHYDIEKYVKLRAEEIYMKGYDLEYLNELLEKASEYPGRDRNEYEMRALEKVIDYTKATYYADKQENGR
jgi:hypothetical protein